MKLSTETRRCSGPNAPTTKTKLTAKTRLWITLEQSEAAVASLEALRGRLTHYLDSTTPEDRRAVLEALDTRVTVGPGGVLDLSIGVPQHLHDAMADCVHQPQGQ